MAAEGEQFEVLTMGSTGRRDEGQPGRRAGLALQGCSELA